MNHCGVLILIYYVFNKKHKFDGIVFYTYIAMYGVGRFWIEGLRTDSLMFVGVRVSQIVAALCAIVGFGLIFYFSKRKKQKICNESIENYKLK